MSTIKITPLKEQDIQGGITTIQEAFANDPYNLWVYDDRSKVKIPSRIIYFTLSYPLGTANPWTEQLSWMLQLCQSCNHGLHSFNNC